jgi:hypothetical protein
VLAARGRRATVRSGAPLSADVSENAEDIQARLKAREAPQPKFCWRCRKALHARNDKCPFCGEPQ